jgi:hypothetical protein
MDTPSTFFFGCRLTTPTKPGVIADIKSNKGSRKLRLLADAISITQDNRIDKM